MQTSVFSRMRADMVDKQVVARGVYSLPVLEAMRAVPREVFVPEPLHEFAYDDIRIPVAMGQQLPRPSMVGVMLAALDLRGTERVLEIGTGAGYVTALLSHLAQGVHSIEPQGPAAAAAADTLHQLGCANVQVRHASAEVGWAEEAPFDAILVHGTLTEIPPVLKRQLSMGGRLVMALGSDPEVSELVRLTRLADDHFRTEDMADLQPDPLLGEESHVSLHPGGMWARVRRLRSVEESVADHELAHAIAAAGERFATPGTADLGPLLDRIGESRVVLLGEATHGSSDFYRMRDRITRELILRQGFSFLAIEGDWPDAARIDQHVQGGVASGTPWTAFARFPTWMWRNQEVRSFVEWLRTHNTQSPKPVAFHGLDLYSMYNSISAVLGYLAAVDPATARMARQRYACLTPWQINPASYGLATQKGRYESCEKQVVEMLVELQHRSPLYATHDGDRLLDVLQNARVVSHAERYYRTMYYGSRAAWNLRDTHMFETLKTLLAHHGAQSKAVIWAHNSHVGDSAATEMSLRGEFNLGHLCRTEFGKNAYLVGFGTHAGTVAAASDWGGPMEIKTIRPALTGSYEKLFHDTGVARFLLPFRQPSSKEIVEGLMVPVISNSGMSLERSEIGDAKRVDLL